MGLFDYFQRRRERESALGGLSMDGTAPMMTVGQSRPERGEWTLGPDVAGQSSTRRLDAPGLAELGKVGALILQASREGRIQIHEGTPKELDLAESGLREEILEALSRSVAATAAPSTGTPEAADGHADPATNPLQP